jgi:Thiamine pyrophosphate enzyme, central domain
MTVAVADLVRRGLAALGVEAAYGVPYPGLAVARVDDAAVAALMAEAHLLVHRTRCAVHRGGGEFAVHDRGGSSSPVALEVADEADLTGCWGAAEDALRAGAVSVAVRVGLGPGVRVDDRPIRVPAPLDRWQAPTDEDVARLAGAESPVALVGPGVADEASVPGVHALATAADLSVLNTWGAKGVFDWRSRHHAATVGLQADDLVLGGLADADLVVTAGLHPGELVGVKEPGAPTLALAPTQLGPLAERVARPRTEPVVPPLRHGLAAVTQEGWAVGAAPLPPTRVTLTYAQVVGARGLVAADPGLAGYWVARTFATTSLGGAVVPARASAHGLAAACVAVARLRWPARPALAVTGAGTEADAGAGTNADAGDRMTERVVAAAGAWGVAVPVERWAPGGPALDAEAHAARLAGALAAERSTTNDLATDPRQLDRMVEVAGDVVAWGGLHLTDG